MAMSRAPRRATDEAQNVPSGSFALPVAISGPRHPADGHASVRTRAADPVATFPLALPTGRTLPAPPEWRRGLVPVPGHGLEPGDDLAGVARVLTVQRPALQDPLDALGHVQPGAPHRRVQR